MGWIGRHRGLVGFGGGLLVAAGLVAAVGLMVLAHERRAARLAAATLSRVLGREVEIARVPTLSPGRVVVEGLRLPAAGGWPAEVRAESVEASGRLAAAAVGDQAPVSVVVRHPTVAISAASGGGTWGWLEGLEDAVAGLLAQEAVLDVSLVGGTLERDGRRAEFDLSLRKGPDGARVVVVVRGDGTPLRLTLAARSGEAGIGLEIRGSGSLGPLRPWLPGSLGLLADQPLDLGSDATLPRSGSGEAMEGRLHLSLLPVVALEGTASLRDRVVRIREGRVVGDLGAAAALAGLAWHPVGQGELDGLDLTWRPEAGGLPSGHASFRAPTLSLPAGEGGPGVAVSGLTGTLALAPPDLRVEAALAGVQVAGLTGGGRARARIALGPDARPLLADVERWEARLPGAAVTGTARFDVGTGRATIEARADDLDAAPLLRALGQGWVGPRDRLRVRGLTLVATDVDTRERSGGRLTVGADQLGLEREDGRVSTGAVSARVTLAREGATVTVDARQPAGDLPWLRGGLAGLAVVGRLGREARGSLAFGEATAVARDGEGREALRATARPEAGGGIGLALRLPALERLDRLWPAVARKVTGSADVDARLAGTAYGRIEGQLRLHVPEAEALAGRLFVRDVEAEIPFRIGGPDAPPWGRLTVGEALAYRVLVRDIRGAVQVTPDRLSLAGLTYALYAGEGRAAGEVVLGRDGPAARLRLSGERVRIEEFLTTYGVTGGTMTGLLRYDLEARAGVTVSADGWAEVPEGGVVNIELLNRLLVYAGSDPTGVVKSALENLRSFDYKTARVDVRTPPDGDIRLTLALRGRERFGIFPPRVREINIRAMPLSFLVRQLTGR